MSTPTEIFRVRNSQLSEEQRMEFELYSPATMNSTSTTLDRFQLIVDGARDAHLYVVDELVPGEEIDLFVQMKIFKDRALHSVSVMKLLIYVSQFDFHP